MSWDRNIDLVAAAAVWWQWQAWFGTIPDGPIPRVYRKHVTGTPNTQWQVKLLSNLLRWSLSPVSCPNTGQTKKIPPRCAGCPSFRLLISKWQSFRFRKTHNPPKVTLFYIVTPAVLGFWMSICQQRWIKSSAVQPSPALHRDSQSEKIHCVVFTGRTEPTEPWDILAGPWERDFVMVAGIRWWNLWRQSAALFPIVPASVFHLVNFFFVPVMAANMDG